MMLYGWMGEGASLAKGAGGSSKLEIKIFLDTIF